MRESINVAIAGATGYIGLELINILKNHPKVKIRYLLSKNFAGKNIKKFDQRIGSRKLPKLSNIKKINWNNVDVIFTALPNGEAQKIAKKINKKKILIDLSADFRLSDPKIYKKWYKINHKCKNMQKKAVYAISEFKRNYIKTHKIISCPGCYPTSIQLPLIPVIKKKLIKTNNILVDSKSGYSGAGKNLKKKFKFKNLYDSVSAYGVGSHRHMAEIDQELSLASKTKINVQFTPHLIPMFRGILSTIYVELSPNVTAKKVYNFLKLVHKNNKFVRIKKFNVPIGTGNVMNTNFCDITVCNDRSKNKAIIISCIDNLIKGGSGQAVQNMNIAFNFKESAGLK